MCIATLGLFCMSFVLYGAVDFSCSLCEPCCRQTARVSKNEICDRLIEVCCTPILRNKILHLDLHTGINLVRANYFFLTLNHFVWHISQKHRYSHEHELYIHWACGLNILVPTDEMQGCRYTVFAL